MAEAIQVFGKTDVKVAIASDQPLEQLGVATDMIEPEERVFLHNAPSDAHGGPQGPPIEVQILGAIAVIPLRLSVWDAAVADKLRQRNFAALGTIADLEIGQLMFQDGSASKASFRLCLVNPTAPINFWNCIIREPISAPRGTKWSELNVIVEAHRAPPGHSKAGVLYDSDVTSPGP